MRIKRPRVASLDEVRIRPDAEAATIEFADTSIASTHLTIGPRMRGLATNMWRLRNPWPSHTLSFRHSATNGVRGATWHDMETQRELSEAVVRLTRRSPGALAAFVPALPHWDVQGEIKRLVAKDRNGMRSSLAGVVERFRTG
jgi:hypothetical protein